MTAAPELPYPPTDLASFLQCCAGEWMSLRSLFDVADAAAGEGDEWHSSERGELMVSYLAPAAADAPGGLSVGPKGQPQQELHFQANGSFSARDQQGRWTLWPDGSLELVLEQGEQELRERIWFNKPNLRLRSTVKQGKDGELGRASFSSEIRRVSRPAA